MQQLLHTVESLQQYSGKSGKSPLAHLGFISCAHQVHIRHVPVYEPCILVVMQGRKVIYQDNVQQMFDSGSVITLPAPASFDLRNEPASSTRPYRALIIPFKHEHLQKLQQTHDFGNVPFSDTARLLRFHCTPTLRDGINHYLRAPQNPRVLEHRLLELLLNLVEQDPRLLGYMLGQRNWSARVRSILSSNLTLEWELNTICEQLNVSESTLRRHLQRENTGFRDILTELRLGAALMQLLQTDIPVNQIAYECGYQSVPRFIASFRKRFGLPPGEFRQKKDESGNSLTVSEHRARA